MNKMLLVWMAIAGLLTLRSFQRPSYAVGLYMLTFFAHPFFWWWGNAIEGYRWNFFAGVLLLGTLALTQSRARLFTQGVLSTNAARIVLFMALNVLLVHALLAVNDDSSLGWVTNRLKFILLFVMLQYSIRDQQDFRIVAMSIALGMGYIGYEATINERGSFSGGRLEGIGAAGVTSSNQLASLLITGLPLATSLLFTSTTRATKAVTIICCALAFNVVLMCNSRGAFLGVLMAGVVFLVMASGPARKQSKRIIALAMVGTFLLMGDPEILQRFLTTFSGDTERDTSAQSRIEFWTSASRMLRDYPLGSGGNSFSEGRGWRYMPGMTGRSAGGNPNQVGNTRAIHNGFLTEATDWGVQGFAIMLLFLWAVWQTTWKGRKLALFSNDANGMMVFGCMAASLVAWMVSSVFGDYLNDEWGFWAAGLSYAYLRLYTLEPAASPISEDSPAVSTLALPRALPEGFSS